MADPFGRALRDHHRGEQDDPLVVRDGETTREHPVEAFYFEEYTVEDVADRWLASWLDGPLLDVGAGVGRHALHFQESMDVTAIEVSEALVETMRERGVVDARHADMFALREQFARDHFASAFAHGTQVGLAGSMQGLRRFLGDLAHVTTPDATAVFDGYDPDTGGVEGLLGYRADPTPGLASRVFHFEYDGDVGETLLFRLFSPGRVREATTGTGWHVAEVSRDASDDPFHYRVALEKA